MYLFRCFIILFVVVMLGFFAGCGGGDGGGTVAPDVHLTPVSATPFRPLTVTLLNPTPHDVLALRWKLGQEGANFPIDVPLFGYTTGGASFRVPAALGLLESFAFTAFKGGWVELLVTRTVDGENATISLPFKVLELPPLWPPSPLGAVAMDGARAAREVVADWIASIGILEAYQGSLLTVDSILGGGAIDIQSMQVLTELITDPSTVLGAAGGSLAVFDAESLPVADRFIRALAVTLAYEKGDVPPAVGEYSNFFGILDSDPDATSQEKTEQYLETMSGAAALLFSAFERATVAKVQDQPMLNPSQLGGLAWSTLACFSLASEFTMAVLAGQAVLGKDAFEEMAPAALSHAAFLAELGEEHFFESLVTGAYGSELTMLGQNLTWTLKAAPELHDAIATGFILGKYPASGVPQTIVTVISLEKVHVSGPEWHMTAMTDPPMSDLPLVLFLVSSDRLVQTYSAATDGTGMANFEDIPFFQPGTTVVQSFLAGEALKSKDPLFWSSGVWE